MHASLVPAADLVDEAVLKALGLGHELLGAAVAVPRRRGVSYEIPVIDLEDHRLNETCSVASTFRIIITSSAALVDL